MWKCKYSINCLLTMINTAKLCRNLQKYKTIEKGGQTELTFGTGNSAPTYLTQNTHTPVRH